MKLAVINKPTNWRLRVARNLNEVNPRCSCQVESVTKRHDAKLLSLLSNDTHLARTNPTVHAHCATKRKLRGSALQNIDKVLAARREQVSSLLWIWCNTTHACEA